MTPSTRVIAGLAVLLSIGLLSRAEHVGPVSAATRPGLQEGDEDSVDAYIRAGMHTAHIPGLALAVMQLVEAGKIDLDAPVTRYLPWFRTRDQARSAQISVRHLLHQTSGLQTYEGRQGFWDNDQSRYWLLWPVAFDAPYPRRMIPAGFLISSAEDILSRFWRLYVPLAVDLCSVAVIWILVPASVHAPMAAVALFAPDVFAVLVAITGLAAGCAAARTVVALRSRRRLAPARHSRPMEAVVQYQYGSPDVLELRNIDAPAIGDDGVLVRVVAAGLHVGDWHVMTGLPYMLRLVGFGLRAPRVRVRGIDVAGTVEAVGPRVTQLRVGDDVFGTCDGSFAEYASARQDMLAPKPANLSFDQAAAVPTSSFAALQALRDRGEIRPGQRVLIVGASGGVGIFAVQIAKALGAEVTGVCSAAKAGTVRAIGADHVIDYAHEDFSRSGQRYDLVLDVGGGRTLSALRRALTPRGTLVLVGGEEGGRLLGGTGKWIQALLVSPFVRQKLRPLSTTPRRTDLAFVTELIDSGKMTPVIDRTFTLKEVPEAFRYLERGRARGKIVIQVKQSAMSC